MRTKKKPFGAVLLLIASTIFCSSSTAITADKIKFQLDWIIEGKYVPFFVARDKGFFKKNGSALTLLEAKARDTSPPMVTAVRPVHCKGASWPASHVISKAARNRASGLCLTCNG